MLEYSIKCLTGVTYALFLLWNLHRCLKKSVIPLALPQMLLMCSHLKDVVLIGHSDSRINERT